MSLLLGNSGSFSVNFSPNGRLAVAAVGIAKVKIFDAQQKLETTFLSGHSDTVTTVSFSADGSRIYSESEKEKLVWDVATRETIPDATWELPEVTTNTSRNGRWLVTTESNNVVLVDLEFKNTPDEIAYRLAKSRFDPFWHQEHAEAATTAQNWYAAVFHYAWLLKHGPDSLARYVGLSPAHRVRHPCLILFSLSDQVRRPLWELRSSRTDVCGLFTATLPACGRNRPLQPDQHDRRSVAPFCRR